MKQPKQDGHIVELRYSESLNFSRVLNAILRKYRLLHVFILCAFIRITCAKYSIRFGCYTIMLVTFPVNFWTIPILQLRFLPYTDYNDICALFSSLVSVILR